MQYYVSYSSNVGYAAESRVCNNRWCNIVTTFIERKVDTDIKRQPPTNCHFMSKRDSNSGMPSSGDYTAEQYSVPPRNGWLGTQLFRFAVRRFMQYS